MTTEFLTLFHGTQVAHATTIASNGLLASSHGRLGPAIYLTDNYEVAKSRAIQVCKGQGMVVLTVQVRVTAPPVDLKDQMDTTGTWSNQGKAIAKGQHPAWLGHAAFNEWAVRDATLCKVTNMTVVSSANMPLGAIQNPNLNVRILSGVVDGPIHCDTLTIG